MQILSNKREKTIGENKNEEPEKKKTAGGLLDHYPWSINKLSLDYKTQYCQLLCLQQIFGSWVVGGAGEY